MRTTVMYPVEADTPLPGFVSAPEPVLTLYASEDDISDEIELNTPELDEVLALRCSSL